MTPDGRAEGSCRRAQHEGAPGGSSSGLLFATLARELALLVQGLAGTALALEPCLPAEAGEGADTAWPPYWRRGGAAEVLQLPAATLPGLTPDQGVRRLRLGLLVQLQLQAQGSWALCARERVLQAAGPLASLFTLLEHWRAEAGLPRRWPGIAPQLQQARASALAARPATLAAWQAGTPRQAELLRRLSLGARLVNSVDQGLSRGTVALAEMDEMAEMAEMAEMLRGLALPAAQAEDSLAAARWLLARWQAEAGGEAVAPDVALESSMPTEAAPAAATAAEMPGADPDGSVDASMAGDAADGDATHPPGQAADGAGQAPAGPRQAVVRSGAAIGSAADSVAGARTDPAERATEPAPVGATSPRLAHVGRAGHPPLPPVPADARVHLVDEWDHHRQRYLPAWCRVIETRLAGGELDRVRAARRRHGGLLRAVWRQFAALRPQALAVQRGCSDGEEIEFDAVVEAVLERRRGVSPPERLHRRRARGRREVATAFLVDLSASTDFVVPDGVEAGTDRGTESAPSPALPSALPPAPDADDDHVYLYGPAPRGAAVEAIAHKRRVIDVQHDALVLMCDALAALGDRHAVYGFSGQGRHQVELLVAKEFDERLDARQAAALAAMQPRGATRMGAAIRLATIKLARQPERQKLLIVVSDGYPQDQDYGPDRLDDEWGLHDTAQALAEAQRSGITTFSVTVDPAGHDYLRRMCPDGCYRVIDEVAQLPAALGQVYRALCS